MGEILTIDAEDYRGRPGVNPSLLEIIFEQSEAHAKAALDGHNRRETEAMRFGTLFHARVLEPDTLDYHVEPATYVDDKGVDQPWHGGRKFCKAWKAAHSDKPIVKQSDVGAIEGMAESLRNYPEFMELFRGGKSEQSLFATDSHDTLLKGRLDRLRLTGNVVLDLKKTKSCKREDFERQIIDLGYHRRASFYLDLCQLCGLEKEVFILAAVEATPPYVAQLYRLSDAHIDAGRSEYRALLQRYRNAVAANQYPAYGGGIPTIDLPEWYADAIDIQH